MSARTDTERLDWLEKRDASNVELTREGNGSKTWHALYFNWSNRYRAKGDTVREVIDTAMDRDQAEGGSDA